MLTIYRRIIDTIYPHRGRGVARPRPRSLHEPVVVIKEMNWKAHMFICAYRRTGGRLTRPGTRKSTRASNEHGPFRKCSRYDPYRDVVMDFFTRELGDLSRKKTYARIVKISRK